MADKPTTLQTSNKEIKKTEVDKDLQQTETKLKNAKARELRIIEIGLGNCH